MRWHRIRAILVHTWYHLHHSIETWTDIFWFPVVNTAVISMFALYLSTNGEAEYGKALLCGLTLWFALEPASYSIAVGALWEVWAKNFSSLFISPLTLTEFIAGQILFSIAKEILLIAVITIMSVSIFGFTVFSLGPIALVYVLLQMLFGWAFGCFILGLVLRFGTRIQSLAWGLVYAVQPFIGMYYPIDMFPKLLQNVAKTLPPTYVYEAMRLELSGSPNNTLLLYALILDTVYFMLGYYFVRRMWEQSRRNGALARMEE